MQQCNVMKSCMVLILLFSIQILWKNAPDLKWACLTQMCPLHALAKPTPHPMIFFLCRTSYSAKQLVKKEISESSPVHTVRNHFPVFICINRLLIVFMFFSFLQLLKHGFRCLHIFKKSSFILHKQYGFLYLLQLPANVIVMQED